MPNSGISSVKIPMWWSSAMLFIPKSGCQGFKRVAFGMEQWSLRTGYMTGRCLWLGCVPAGPAGHWVHAFSDVSGVQDQGGVAADANDRGGTHPGLGGLGQWCKQWDVWWGSHSAWGGEQFRYLNLLWIFHICSSWKWRKVLKNSHFPREWCPVLGLGVEATEIQGRRQGSLQKCEVLLWTEMPVCWKFPTFQKIFMPKKHPGFSGLFTSFQNRRENLKENARLL